MLEKQVPWLYFKDKTQACAVVWVQSKAPLSPESSWMCAGRKQVTRQTLQAKLAVIFHCGNSSFSKTKSVVLPQHLSWLCI